MDKNAKLILNDKTYELPVKVGSEGEVGLEIKKLRASSGAITLDPGFGNTGACTSAITYIDGDKGILRHRGYAIEDLAENSTYVETAYMLIFGELPTKPQLDKFSKDLTEQATLHEDLKNFFNGFPPNVQPMLVLSTMISALSSYHPELAKPELSQDDIYQTAVKLISKVRTIAAFSYRKSVGKGYIHPRKDLKYVPNFLHMMFSDSDDSYEADEEIVKALQILFVLHADHEQNCSTSTVRLVGSSQANLSASIAAGIFALWGPLHGGANQEVIQMLEQIQKDGGNYKKYIEMAKDKNSNFLLMGFGHRVYKNFDPRARIIDKLAIKLIERLGINDPMLELAHKLQEDVLKDSFFIERKLYPNVDFYSGIIFRAIGIPLNMFPVMFAIARMAGWIAQWKEMRESPEFCIGRPRQIYTGSNLRKYVPSKDRVPAK